MGKRGQGSEVSDADFNTLLESAAPSRTIEPQVDIDDDRFNALLDQASTENDPLGYLKAAAAGAARGFTFGLSDVGLTQSGLVDAETLRTLQEVYPGTSLAGEAAGILGPTLATGGTSLAARGALQAGRAVTGVSKLGRMTETAISKGILNTAEKQGVKKALSQAAAKGVGSGVEGAFYGTGQVVSEAALGETPPTAEKVLSTIGLSSLLSGAFVGAGSIGGDILGAIGKSIKPKLPLLRRTFTGVGKDVEKTVLTRGDELAEFSSKFGDDVDEGLAAAFVEKSDDIQNARKLFIQNTTKNVEDIIQKNKIAGKSAEIGPILQVIRSARSKNIGPKAFKKGEAPTREIESLAAALDDLEARLISTARRDAGIADNISINPDSLRIRVSELNRLKQNYGLSADFSGKIDKGVISQLYDDLYKASNKQLDEIDKAIRAENSKISRGIKAQEKLKRYGLFDRFEVDPAKLRQLATTNERLWSDALPHLKLLDDLWGTDLVKFGELARAYKALMPKDAFARSFTGRSLLETGVGSVFGGALAGPVGAAVGAGAGLAIQSPLGTKAKIKVVNALDEAISGKLKKTAANLQANSAAFVPDNLAPFVSAKIASLGILERRVNEVDRQIESGVKGFLKGGSSKGSNVDKSLQDSPFGADRAESISIDKAFTRRMEEISKLATDPVYLQQKISEAMAPLMYVAPEMAKYLDGKARTGIQYLNEQMPKKDSIDNPFKKEAAYEPTDTELYKFARIVKVTEDPLSILKDLKQGSLTQDSVEALKMIYPHLYEQIKMKIVEMAGEKTPNLDYGQLITLGALFDIDTADALENNLFARLQMNFLEENRDAQTAAQTDLQGYGKIAQSSITTGQRIGG